MTSIATDANFDSWSLYRWFACSATLNIPQAAGPVAFSLVALHMTGNANGGATMILAMTLAQVAGAVPITRLGRRFSASSFLKALVFGRSLALAGMVLSVSLEAPFVYLVVLAGLTGAVNGAAYGYLRSVLNHLTPASKLPRALGIASTLNELTFVLAPVAASGLAAFSPGVSIAALTILGVLPALLVPVVASTPLERTPSIETTLFSRNISIWLFCAMAGGAAVAAIEIGAVALAISFGYAPVWAILFTVPLCLASVGGGIWVSVRNRVASKGSIVVKLLVMTTGTILAAVHISIETTIIGSLLIGAMLAPLATYYSLVVDRLAPAHKRPEAFALLRTANAVGVICASAVLTVVSLQVTLIVVCCLMTTAFLLALADRQSVV